MNDIKVILNPDKEVVKQIQKGLLENKKKYGQPYCPCSIIRDEDHICKCKEFRNMIKNKEIGYCHCRLFQIIENNKNKGEDK